MFGAVDGSTSGPDTFVGPIGKILCGSDELSWTITQFKPWSMPSSFFPILHEQVVIDLNKDQFYAYNIMLGTYTWKN